MARSSEAYERFQRVVEIPMLVLPLAVVPIIVVPLVVELSPTAMTGVEAANWLIWVAFVIEYVGLFALAPDRRKMVTSHVLDLLIIVLPFFRPLRAAGGIRLLRAMAGVGRATQAVGRVRTQGGFQSFIGLALIAVGAAGVMVWAFEHNDPASRFESIGDGLWWAVSTTTTVGYGDFVPVTPEGRAIAVALMVLGIAVLAVITANIAAYFIESDTPHESAELIDRLDRLEAKLDLLLGDDSRR